MYKRPLYNGYRIFWQQLSICFIASLWDVAMILFLYILFALISKDMLWFQNLNPESVFSLLTIGALVGIGIERWALAAHRWSYNNGMPIIPFLEVGFVPVLQMMILPSYLKIRRRK